MTDRDPEEEERRRQIEERLRLAMIALGDRGEVFSQVSVEKLAREAGMVRSTFYRYFGDKAALLSALETATMHIYSQSGASWMRRGVEVTEEQIRADMLATLQSFQDNEVVMTALAEAMVSDPKLRAQYARHVEDYAGGIAKLVRQGQKAGVTPKDLRPKETGLALSWMIERTVQQQARGASKKQLERIAEGMAGVISLTIFAA